jgi:hypothetical protein
MKKHFIIFRSLLLLAFVFTLQNVSFSQPPPPPTTNHGSSGNAAPGGGGGAPVGDGLVFLVAMAGLYGGKKIYDARKTAREIEA